MSDKNKISGTVSEYREDSNSSRSIISNLIQARDFWLIVGGVLVLQLLGVIDLPFLNQIESIPYGDAILSAIIGALVTRAVIWGRFRAVLEEIYSKNWAYLILVSATGNVAGAWKTDPYTLNRTNEAVEFVDSDKAEIHREGVDKSGRRYAIIKDLSESDTEGVEWELENVDTYPQNITEDMVIADKEHLKYILENLQEDAEFGRKARMSLKSRIKHYINKLSAQLSVMHQHATNDGTSDPEALYEESIEGFERLELDVDDLGKDTSDELSEQVSQQIEEEIRKQGNSEPAEVDEQNKGDQE